MKKKYIILASVVAVVIVAAVFASLWGKKNTHGNAIPKDATAVALFDMKKLVSEADLDAEELQHIAERILHLDVKIRELGLDLTQPIYGFATKDGNLGAVAAVSDQDNLETLCTLLHERGQMSAISHQRGYVWATVAQQWLLCFDGSKALVMGPAVGDAQDRLRPQMVSLMQQGRKESGMLSPNFPKLTAKDEPLTIVADAHLMPAEWQDKVCEMLNVPQLEDVQLLLGIDAEGNRIEIDADIISGQPNVQAQLQHLNDLLRPIKGSLIERAHSSGLLCLMCNVEGDALLELLRKNPEVRTGLLGLNMMVDADQMLKAIDGDVMLEMTDLTFLLGWSRVPSLRLLADIKDSDFLQQKDYWLKSAAEQSAYSLTAAGQDFCLKANGYSAWFGVDDDILYVASNRDLGTVERAPQENATLAAELDDIQECRLYLTLDMRPFAAMGRLFGGDNALGLLRLFQRIEIEMKDAGSFEILLLAPEGKNLAKSLILK